MSAKYFLIVAKCLERTWSMMQIGSIFFLSFSGNNNVVPQFKYFYQSHCKSMQMSYFLYKPLKINLLGLLPFTVSSEWHPRELTSLIRNEQPGKGQSAYWEAILVCWSRAPDRYWKVSCCVKQMLFPSCLRAIFFFFVSFSFGKKHNKDI